MEKKTVDESGSSKSDLKKQIRELKVAIATAITEKQGGEVKNLRRRVKRLKARTRELARGAGAAGAVAAAPSEPPSPLA